MCGTPYCSRVGINNYVVNPKNVGIRIWQNECVKYDKIEIAAILSESNIYPKCILLVSGLVFCGVGGIGVGGSDGGGLG